MSSAPSATIANAVIPENMIRDYKNTISQAVNYIFDIVTSGRAVGLDLYIRNRGAAALTIAVDGQAAITVDPGDVYIFNNTKFWMVNIQSAVLFDFQIFGILVNTLKARGLL